MRNFISIVVFCLFLMTGCTGVKSTTQGLENQSFLELVGTPRSYSNGVEVLVDKGTPFKAEVHKAGKKRPKGSVYAIPTGKHVVTVKYKGKVIYSRQIFVSAQETKLVVLP